METTEYLKMDDGVRIFFRMWEVEQPRALVQIIHGMDEHSERYRAFAAFLNTYGITVFATDHRGHGYTAGSLEKVGYIGEDGFEKMVADERVIQLYMQERCGKQLPVFMLGHSMGSFITQRFIQQHGETLAGAILVGSCGYNSAVKMGKIAAAFSERIKRDEYSKVLEGLIFRGYNKKTAKRTMFDWVAADDAVVDAYLADPYCGNGFPPSFYRQFMVFLTTIFEAEHTMKVPKDLPIYLLSGAEDPVGLYGKGVLRLYAQYRQLGIKSLDMKLYEKSRHEILNDIEKEMVYRDVITWIEHVLKMVQVN